MMSAEQIRAEVASDFWIDAARQTTDPKMKEECIQKAIKNLMIASHGR